MLCWVEAVETVETDQPTAIAHLVERALETPAALVAKIVGLPLFETWIPH